MKTNNAAVHLHAHSATGSFTCPDCGRVNPTPVCKNVMGCAPGELSSEPIDHLEAMQWEAEDELHRTRSRYLRSAKVNGRQQ